MSVVPSIPQVAPINAEDYGSGDLDKTFARSKSLRIETRPTRALEALGINAEDIMQQDEETGPADPFEVGRVGSRLFLLNFPIVFLFLCTDSITCAGGARHQCRGHNAAGGGHWACGPLLRGGAIISLPFLNASRASSVTRHQHRGCHTAAGGNSFGVR